MTHVQWFYANINLRHATPLMCDTRSLIHVSAVKYSSRDKIQAESCVCLCKLATRDVNRNEPI